MAYRSSGFNVSPWQQRGQSYPMGSYSQGYNSYGGYAWNDSYPMNQMGRMAYEPTPFRYGNERPGRNQMSPRRKPMHGKRLPQRSPASGPPSKRPNFGDKTKRRNDQRKRFSRARKNFRRQNREETASDFEEYEILKTPEDDEEKEKEAAAATAQNEETMEVNGIGEKKENEGEEKKEDEKKETTEKKEVKKFTACHVCKVASTHPELVEEHMGSEEHKAKIEAALVVYREKKGAETEKEKSQKKVRPDNWCTVCEIAFNGHFLSHRSTSEHRRIRDKKYPKCRPCAAGFGSAEEYRDHIRSEAHTQKSAEFYHFKKLPIGFDNDDEALEPVKIEEPKEDEAKAKEEAMETDSAEEKKNEDVKAEGDEKKEKETDEKKEKKEDTKKEEKKSKTPSPIGVSFVCEVDGFYCKLCRKFFKDGIVAKKRHCYSVMHYEAYKQAMEVAMKDEEERQRVAEAQFKAEQEAAEAARLAAEIAAIQKEARFAARKIANEKRAAAKKESEQPKEELKDEGIEMSPADEQEKEKTVEVKQEPKKDESSLPEKKEQTEEMCT